MDEVVKVFEGRGVRIIVEEGIPWFVAKDVALILGYKDTVNAVKLHCKGVAKHHPLSTSGGIQQLRVLSEADVYRLIISSKLPEAERFEAWVMEEVLPSISRNGGYLMPTVDFTDPDNIQRLLDAWKADRTKLLEAEARIVKDAPKIEAHDALMRTKKTISITDAAKHFGLPPKTQVFPYLRENGYLTKFDMPSQKALNADLLILREVHCPDGVVRPQALVAVRQLDTWRTSLVPKIITWVAEEDVE